MHTNVVNTGLDCVAGRPVLTRQQYTARIRAVAPRRRPSRGQCNAQRPRWLDGSVDCRPLVPDAVSGEEASRFLSPFWEGAPARGSAHGRPSGAHGVRRACCLLQCRSAYTSTGLSWTCNETFFTAMFKIQTPELADGRLAVFSPYNIWFLTAARVSLR